MPITGKRKRVGVLTEWEQEKARSRDSRTQGKSIIEVGRFAGDSGKNTDKTREVVPWSHFLPYNESVGKSIFALTPKIMTTYWVTYAYLMPRTG